MESHNPNVPVTTNQMKKVVLNIGIYWDGMMNNPKFINHPAGLEHIDHC